jgi:hypothetical protein
MAGIVEFKQKIDTIKRFLEIDSGTNKDLVTAVYTGTDVDRYVSALGHWSTSTPTNPEYTAFIRTLINKCGIQGKDFQWFVKCSHSEFCRHLPDNKKSTLQTRVLEEGRKTLNEFHIIHRHISHNPVETGSIGHLRDELNQVHMYQTRESWKSWQKIKGSSEYRSFRECVNSLEAVLNSNSFYSLFADNSPGLACLFGVGSPEKEMRVAEFLHKCGKPGGKSAILLLDASYYMLVNSHNAVLELVNQEGLNVDIESYQLDFTKKIAEIGKIRDKFSHSRCLFIITGGTFGNNREGDFMGFMDTMTRSGDVFIVSVEFYDPSNREEYLENLLGLYGSNVVKDLALCSVRAMLDGKDVSPNKANRRKRIKAKKVVNPAISSIEQTVGIEVYLELDVNETMSLTISKRYCKEKFIGYIESFGFELITLNDLANGHDFGEMKQVVFRKR